MESTTPFINILKNIWRWGAYTLAIFCFARILLAVFLPHIWDFWNSNSLDLKESIRFRIYLDLVLYWSNTRPDDLFSDTYLYGIEEITIFAALKRIATSMTLNFEYLYLKFRQNREYLHLYNIIVINYCAELEPPPLWRGSWVFLIHPKRLKVQIFPVGGSVLKKWKYHLFHLSNLFWCYHVLLIYTIFINLFCISQEEFSHIESNPEICELFNWIIF